MKYLGLVYLLVAVALTAAQRRRRPRVEGDRYSWERNMTNGILNETAFSPDGKNMVFLGMRPSEELREMQILPIRFYYDFTGASGVTAFKLGRMCFLLDTTIDYATLISTLETRNNSDEAIPAGSTTALDGTGDPMSAEDKAAAIGDAEFVRRLCGRSRMVQLTAPAAPAVVAADAADAEADATKTVSVMSLNGQLDITLKARRRRPAGPGSFRPFGGNGPRGGPRGGPRAGPRRGGPRRRQ